MLEQGARLADLIVERARPMFVGRGWGTPHGDATREAPLCGLGHGASGVALAVDELATRTGETRWADASHDAVRYERSLFDRGEQNWADLREFHLADLAAGRRPAYPVYWCHGAVGVGLARFRRWELVGDLAALAEAAAATDCALRDVETRTASYVHDYGHNFSMCHGFAGTVELLLCAAAHGDARGRDAAVRIGRFGREHCVGSPAGWPCGVRDGGETPGLMLGLAGIGSCYLRLADDRAVSPTWWLAADGTAGAPDPLPTVEPVSAARQPRVIVQIATSAGEPTTAAVSLLERVPGGRVVRVSPRGRAVVELPPGADTVAVAAELQADPRVVYAEPDVIDTALPTDG
jgi:lantibiotic modifying enzyme